MKKYTLIIASLGIVVLLAGFAYAQGGYGRMGNGWGGGYCWNQTSQYDQGRTGYQTGDIETRKELASKRLELETLIAQPGFDRNQAETLQQEITALERDLGNQSGGMGRGQGYGGARGFRW